MIENIQESVNNDFCKYVKELWCKSAIKQKSILLTKATRVCEIDGLTCINWNNEVWKSLSQHNAFVKPCIYICDSENQKASTNYNKYSYTVTNYIPKKHYFPNYQTTTNPQTNQQTPSSYPYSLEERIERQSYTHIIHSFGEVL